MTAVSCTGRPDRRKKRAVDLTQFRPSGLPPADSAETGADTGQLSFFEVFRETVHLLAMWGLPGCSVKWVREKKMSAGSGAKRG